MNIYEKLLAIQTELKAPKSQYNDFGRYNYRNCEDILEAVKPLLAKHRAALKISDELVMIGDRYYIKATATLYDTALNNFLPVLIENTAFAREEAEKKGMDGSQVTGASSSYARKYALNGLFAIDDTKDSDTTNKGDYSSGEKFGSIKEKLASQKEPVTPATPVKPVASQDGMTLEQASAMCFKNGRNANIPFGELNDDSLIWAANNLSGAYKTAAELVLEDRRRQEENPFPMTTRVEVDEDDGLPF